MSNKYPVGYQYSQAPNQGVLSDWDKITTNTGIGETPPGDHAFTIADLLNMVKTFRDEFNPEFIAKSVELIERHIARTDNPHMTSLDNMGTSVMQELYTEWLNAGYQGTREEFLKVLFQYVQVADVSETLAGESYTKVVSPAGLKTVVDQHNDDPYAHDALMARLMPGTPIKYTPSFSLQPIVGLESGVIVKRDSPMWIINETGQVKTIPEDTLETDYSTGEPAFPIFQELTNGLEDSLNFDHPLWWTTENATVEQTVTIDNINYPDRPTYVLREKHSDIPKIHSIVYLRENFAVLKGEYYTVTAIVAPMERRSIGIDIMDDLDYSKSFGFAKDIYGMKTEGASPFGFDGSKLAPFDQGTFADISETEYSNIEVVKLEQSGFLPFDQGTFYSHTGNVKSQRFAQFDLDKEEIFISEDQPDIHGAIYPLHNGHYRIQCTFKAAKTVALKIKFYLLDIFDGDKTYEGIEGYGMAIFGATLTKGSFLPPYMISELGVKGHISKTSVQIPINDEWFRKEVGTIVMRVNNNSINKRLADVSELYNIGNGADSLALLARQPVGHANRIYMAGYTDNNEFISANWTEPCEDQWISFMHGYNGNVHMYGGPNGEVITVDIDYRLNQDMVYLYLGCNRYLDSQLNGFITSFIYYPELLEPGNLAFFTMKFNEV